jgi:hypothetical protein
VTFASSESEALRTGRDTGVARRNSASWKASSLDSLFVGIARCGAVEEVPCREPSYFSGSHDAPERAGP